MVKVEYDEIGITILNDIAAKSLNAYADENNKYDLNIPCLKASNFDLGLSPTCFLTFLPSISGPN